MFQMDSNTLYCPRMYVTHTRGIITHWIIWTRLHSVKMTWPSVGTGFICNLPSDGKFKSKLNGRKLLIFYTIFFLDYTVTGGRGAICIKQSICLWGIFNKFLPSRPSPLNKIDYVRLIHILGKLTFEYSFDYRFYVK